MCILKSLFKKTPSEKALIILYKDLARPGVQQVGKAIKNIISLVLFPFSDVPAYLTARGRLILRKNFERFRAKLSNLPVEKTEEVPAEIGVPILQKLSYVQDEDISELFINLLTKASFSETSELAHPSFINCINNMSSDEAKIITYLKTNPSLPYVIARFQFNEKEGLDRTPILTGLESVINLKFPKNIPVYIENLTGLGIITREISVLSDEQKYYKPLYKQYEGVRVRIENEGHGGMHYPVIFQKGYYKLTPYGSLFINACIKEIELDQNTLK